MKALTAMQAAYWVGRKSSSLLGGVSAHLYAEFDGNGIEVRRLQHAVTALYQHHPTLRLRINDDGEQIIDPVTAIHCLHVDNWQQQEESKINQALSQKRERKSTQMLPLDQGIACDISLTLLPDQRHRLHIDVDMIACDAMGFRRLLEDMTLFYHQGYSSQTPEPASWFDYLAKRDADQSRITRRNQAQRWWRERLAQMPPAPHLLRTPDVCRSDRLAIQLNAGETAALNAIAKSHHLTLSALFLSLFAVTVGHGWSLSRFRLNVPLFHRDNYVANVDELVADFSSLVLLSVELNQQESLTGLAHRLMDQLAELISHADYEGVSVTRDLSRLHGSLQSTPVVFTAGFGIEGKTLFSPQTQATLGKLAWVISQGPEVALDAQVAHVEDGILINWDTRQDAFPPGTLTRLFATYRALLHLAAWQPTSLSLNLAQLIAQCTPDVLAQQAPIAALICRLLGRLQQSDAPARDIDMRTLSLAETAWQTLAGVIEKYLGVQLSAEEINNHPTPLVLAALIYRRSPDAASHASILLTALTPE